MLYSYIPDNWERRPGIKNAGFMYSLYYDVQCVGTMVWLEHPLTKPVTTLEFVERCIATCRWDGMLI